MTSRRTFLIRCTQAAAAAVLSGGVAAPRWLQAQDVPDGPAPLIKGPFVQVTGPRSVRLRLETLRQSPLAIRVSRGDRAVEQLAMVRVDEVRYHWPRRDPGGRPVHLPDEQGTFAVQDAVFDQLEPGERYTWSVALGGGEEVTGSFMAPPPSGTPFRLGWIADTRQPVNEVTTAMLTERRPDLVLHGGDLQYQSDPRDTWNNLFFRMEGLLRSAPAHFCVGNHEVEGMDEFESQYQRLLDGQGEPGGGPGYHAFTWAGVRFVQLNTEASLGGPDEPQVRWLEDELTRADAEARYAIVSFHRPIFTFSKRQPAEGVRETLHEVFTRHRVPLVLTGHNHCYERFEVDGVTYLTDGGGGASLYDPDHRLSHFRRREPELLPMRKVSSETRGVTTIDVAADGGLVIERHEAGSRGPAGTTDRFELSPG